MRGHSSCGAGAGGGDGGAFPSLGGERSAPVLLEYERQPVRAAEPWGKGAGSCGGCQSQDLEKQRVSIPLSVL